MPAREPIRMRRAKAWLASVSAALPCMTAPVGAGARRGPRDGVEAAVAQTFRRYRTRERRRGPPREPLARRNVEVENAYRFQCAGWRSAEEYAQGEYGDEISWFSDSGLVEKVQNRQGLFMYFKRRGAASALPRWRSSPRRRGAGARRRRRDGVEAAVVQTFRRYRARERRRGSPREPLTRASRAGTASASTSTCRASRSSSTRTTAATSRAPPRCHRLPNTRTQD